MKRQGPNSIQDGNELRQKDKVMKNRAEIEKIIDILSDSPKEKFIQYVEELNSLTELDWSVEQYYNIIFEYWSHHSFEQIVYYFCNSGNYPLDIEHKVCYWERMNELDISAKEIWERFEHGRALDIMDDFNILSIMELNELLSQFDNNWDRDYDDSDENFISIEMNKYENSEYGLEESLSITLYDHRVIYIEYQNLDDNMVKQINDYFQNYRFEKYVIK